MEFDEERLARLNAWVGEKWKHGACPVCEANEWAPLPRLGQISNLEYAGKMVPVLLISCNNCGYLLAFNAITAGIVPRDSDETDIAASPETKEE